MANPVSISAKNISAAAKGSVAKALERQKAVFPKPDYRLGFIPPYWWVGVVIPHQPSELTLAAAEKLAGEIHHGIADSVSSVKGGKSGVISSGGNLTIGFAPPIEINLIEE